MRTKLSIHDPDFEFWDGRAVWLWLKDNGFDDALVTAGEMIGEGLIRLTCVEEPLRVVDGDLATYTVEWRVRTLPPFMVSSTSRESREFS